MSQLIQRLRRIFGPTNHPPTSTSASQLNSIHLSIHNDDGVVIVRFHDLEAVMLCRELDKIRGFTEGLYSVLQQDPAAVILDFEGKEFTFVPTFECVLAGLHRKLSGRLAMCKLPPRVMEQFEANQLSALIPIRETLDDARQFFGVVDRRFYSVDVPYDCSSCRHSFLVNARLDGCFAPVELMGTHKVNCPHCGKPAFRAPFLASNKGQELLLRGSRWLLGRLPPELQELKRWQLHAPVIEDVMCVAQWIYLDDLCVSRRHAMLTRGEAGKCTIEDIGSASGTIVNNQVINGKVTLQIGDMIRIGQTRIGFCEFPAFQS